MRNLVSFVLEWPVNIMGRLGICAQAGAILGAIDGFFFGQVLSAGLTLTWPDVLIIGLLLVFFGWLVLVVVAGIWLRYGVVQIAIPVLVNSFFTGMATIVILYLARLVVAPTLVGFLIGILVGKLLCALCAPISKKGTKEALR